jgi:hypothetical protein
MSIFDLLIWSGVFLSLAGLAGLIWCIVFVARARKQAQSDDELKATLQKALPLNLGALFLSVIGLMLVVLGIFFG